jgi:hypothetical protein
MVSKEYECGSCLEVFPSKNKLKKHQRKQMPRHIGMTPVINTEVGKKTVKPAVPMKKKSHKTPKKEKKKGDRATGSGGSWRTPKASGPLEPVYDAGFIRISSEKWEEIKDKLPDGASHHIVEATNHHIIEFTGEAYETIDYLMYLHNFVELQMYYQDINFCLKMIPPDERIDILDMCELDESNITGVEGGIIMSEYMEGKSNSISNELLQTSLSSLNGIAIVYGKFKKDSSRAASTSQKTSPKPKPTPVSSPVVETSEKWIMNEDIIIADDPLEEAGEWYMDDEGAWVKKTDDSYCSYCGGELVISGGLDTCSECGVVADSQDNFQQTLWDDFNDYQFQAQEIGYGGGWQGNRGYSGNWGYGRNTYTPSPPVIPKYHPIFGIRGNKLAVDRLVDLTPLIEEGANEESEEDILLDTTNSSNDPDFDPIKADRNKDGEISEWEEKVGNEVAKGIRENKDKKGAETFEGDSELLRGRNRHLRLRQGLVKNWKPQSNTNQLNVATTSLQKAYEWSEKRFQERGLNMKEYIPHFKENYLSLQEECRLAIDIPRVDMPVIDPDELEDFAEKLRGGSLDVFEPFALGDDELYSPRDLVRDTPEALNFLFLGFKDGKLEDDVVNAKIMLTAVGLMRPTQSQIWLNKIVDNIIDFGTPTTNDGVLQGAFNKDSLILKKTIAISQEGYILDGHHRYAQIALVNPSLKMMTLYIGLPIRRLIDVARPYGNAIGNNQRAAEDSTSIE